jgi:hypothetical protein
VTDVKYSDLLKRVSVLFFDPNPTRRELFAEWISRVTTKHASDLEELYDVFDDTVTVVFLSRSALDHEGSEIRNFILDRSPSCQLVLHTAATAERAHSEEYDAVLTRPVSETELRTVVEQRVRYGIYSRLVEEFYALSTTRFAVGNADSDVEEQYHTEIDKRLRQLRTAINHLQSTIDHEDAEKLLKSVNLHRKYLNHPSEKRSVPTQSKYHPDTCPSCSLPWGVDHGNDLETGFDRIGAGVWKCTRCDHVVRNSDASNRYVS